MVSQPFWFRNVGTWRRSVERTSLEAEAKFCSVKVNAAHPIKIVAVIVHSNWRRWCTWTVSSSYDTNKYRNTKQLFARLLRAMLKNKYMSCRSAGLPHFLLLNVREHIGGEIVVKARAWVVLMDASGRELRQSPCVVLRSWEHPLQESKQTSMTNTAESTKNKPSYTESKRETTQKWSCAYH